MSALTRAEFLLRCLADEARDLDIAAGIRDVTSEDVMLEYAEIVGVMTVLLTEKHLRVPTNFHALTVSKIERMNKAWSEYERRAHQVQV